MDSALAALLNQGSAYLLAGVVGRAARQPPPEHRALRDVRRRRRRLRRRVRQRRDLRPPVPAIGAPRAGRATSASRPTRRAWPTATRSGPSSRRPSPPRRPAEWVARLGEAGVPAGPINDIAAAFAFADDLGLRAVGRHRRRAHGALAAAPRTTRPPRCAGARRGSASTTRRSAPGWPETPSRTAPPAPGGSSWGA